MDEDIETRRVRIKRISLFDIEKNRADIEAVLMNSLKLKNTKKLKSYATRYLNLIKTYKDIIWRRTEATGFAEVEVRELTATELQIRQDENGYIGTSVKEVILECSSLDKLLIVYGNGRYHVMSPQISYSLITTGSVRDLIVKTLYCGLYREKHRLYQTFSIGRSDHESRYFMGASEKSKLLLLAEGTRVTLCKT